MGSHHMCFHRVGQLPHFRAICSTGGPFTAWGHASRVVLEQHLGEG